MSKNNFDSGELNYLNTLAAGLVHEIKNPLNAISINLQLLDEDLQDLNSERDKKMSSRVQLLQKEVSRLDSILSDFLRFAKRPVLHFEKCDINGIIESVLDLLVLKRYRTLSGYLGILIQNYRNVIWTVTL